MEHIRQAIERVRNPGPDHQPSRALGLDRQAPRFSPDLHGPLGDEAEPERRILLDEAHLEANRIVAHDDGDPRSKSFHILRTQVVQEMAAKSWQFLAVTSPTSKCQRTATAINLALSVARQPGRSILLVDMDLSKPKIANRLGLRCNKGLVSTLLGRTTLSEAIIPVTIGKYRLLVLPSEAAISNSSEWLASRAMSAVLQELRTSYRSSIVILDLPPILSGDDAISILPHMDCALFVTAIGVSTLSQVKACDEHLRATKVVRIIANKSRTAGPNGG
jgi:Mrp family chromosome partitioning ATPase